jgi:hypothetical protein
MANQEALAFGRLSFAGRFSSGDLPPERVVCFLTGPEDGIHAGYLRADNWPNADG